MGALPDRITITEVSRRSGVAPSALRYYESLGLITAERTRGNQRRYHRGVLRRVAVIIVARNMGVSLRQVRAAFRVLPARRDPTPDDWEKLSRRWREELDGRIVVLERLRDQLSSCIGCGCLSLDRCKLFNQDDTAASAGAGPLYLTDGPPALPGS
jgi:MerR family redox-sensitive transcriptional activator SoxR